jgi:hypothetical protein
MKRFAFLMIAALGAFFMACGSAFGFYCGVNLVSTGDTTSEVTEKCGEPTRVDLQKVVRKSGYYRPNFPEFKFKPYGRYYAENQVFIVERWTYNMGPHKFVRHLEFINDKLRKVKTGGYGY